MARIAQRSRRRRALSLLELLVVVAIVGIVSAAIIPTFARSSVSMRLKNTARRVVDMMNFCHSMAVCDGQTYRFNALEGSNHVWVSFEREPLESPGEFTPYGMSGLADYQLPEGLSVKALLLEERSEEDDSATMETYLEFRKDGTADNAALILVSETEEAYSVLVAALTSRMRIVDYDVEEAAQEDAEEGE